MDEPYKAIIASLADVLFWDAEPAAEPDPNASELTDVAIWVVPLPAEDHPDDILLVESLIKKSANGSSCVGFDGGGTGSKNGSTTQINKYLKHQTIHVVIIWNRPLMKSSWMHQNWVPAPKIIDNIRHNTTSTTSQDQQPNLESKRYNNNNNNNESFI